MGKGWRNFEVHARESLSGLRQSPDCLRQSVSRNLNFKDMADEGPKGSEGHVIGN